MVLNSSQKLIVYALSEFYNSLNQPLTEKPVHVRTSKITFIELLETAMIISAHKRALYKNIEFLEQQKYITYRNHMIAFTAKGLKELNMHSNSGAEVLLKLADLGKKYKMKGPKDSARRIDELLWDKDWSKDDEQTTKSRC